MEKQQQKILPLTNILEQYGCQLKMKGGLAVHNAKKTKRLVIYPAMWAEPQASDTIFVSDAYLKYAKPYAVKKILDNL